MSYFETDREGMLLVPGIHDASITCIRLSMNGALEIELLEEQAGNLRLTFDGTSQPSIWVGGLVIPTIISVAWLCRTRPEFSWLDAKLGDERAKGLDQCLTVYLPKGDGWLLLFDVNYGDPIAVFGSGEFTDETIEIVCI